MKRLAIISTMGVMALSAQSQDLGMSVYYDFQTRDFTPCVTTKLGVLQNFLGTKLNPEIRGFAGVSNARTLAGTALVFSGPLALNARWDLGIGARAMQGSQIGLGVFAGFTIKF